MPRRNHEAQIEARIDRLYEAAPEAFVALRDALAAELRRAGRREEAARVGSLRRPTLAAWALNRAARERPDLVDALVEAGRQLMLAQRRMLAGLSQHGLDEAVRRRREIADALAEMALGALAHEGKAPEAYRAEVLETLRAASLDEESAHLVALGRLVRGLEARAGFDSLGGPSVRG